MSATFRNVSTALPKLMESLLADGTVQESRNGSMREILMANITLTHPHERYITTPLRKASLPAQIAETMWVLAGRNDVEFLAHYLPRAGQFSDDGAVWRGGYGPRLRKWLWFTPGDYATEGLTIYRHERDQLAEVVRLLNEDQNTRRAVMSIFDPAVDYMESKDIPCNNWISFIARDGKLHAQVAIRSNDVMWGWSGINAFEWSALLEIIAGLTGLSVGTLTFATTSLHLYEGHYVKADAIANTLEVAPRTTQEDSRFNADAANRSVAGLDELITRWFRIESIIRTEPRGSAWAHIQRFPDPMMRDWLYVLYGWHHDSMEQIMGDTDLLGSSLAQAALDSPRHPKAVQREREQATSAPEAAQKPEQAHESFSAFVSRLHAEKDAAYGDSWKRRGEMMAIMANCARKVDRLGVDGAGDTSADTAIDLLVYLVKYRLWLTDHAGAPKPDPLVSVTGVLSDDASYVEDMLNYSHYKRFADAYPDSPDSELIDGIKVRFETLTGHAESKRFDRWRYVDGLIKLAYPLAYRLWTEEERVKASLALATELMQVKPLTHAQRNARRPFNGYNITE